MGAIGRERDVDQEFVFIVSHDELVFLRVGAGLEEQFVDFEVGDQIADEFVIPEIDGVEKAEVVTMDEPAAGIIKAFDDHLPNVGRRNAGKWRHFLKEG